MHGDAGNDIIISEAGADTLWGGADADRFAFKTINSTYESDTIMDFQDGLDTITLERLGITSYASTGANGTVYAYDQPDDNVLIRGYTATGQTMTVLLIDSTHTLDASDFSSADFLFA
jgi:Ca2+-binding RTX toxin-like protein